MIAADFCDEEAVVDMARATKEFMHNNRSTPARDTGKEDLYEKGEEGRVKMRPETLGIMQ